MDPVAHSREYQQSAGTTLRVVSTAMLLNEVEPEPVAGDKPGWHFSSLGIIILMANIAMASDTSGLLRSPVETAQFFLETKEKSPISPLAVVTLRDGLLVAGQK